MRYRIASHRTCKRKKDIEVGQLRRAKPTKQHAGRQSSIYLPVPPFVYVYMNSYRTTTGGKGKEKGFVLRPLPTSSSPPSSFCMCRRVC